MAEALPRALEVHGDEFPSRTSSPRRAQRLAVALARAGRRRRRASAARCPTTGISSSSAFARKYIVRGLNAADQRVVDPREVVGRDDARRPRAESARRRSPRPARAALRSAGRSSGRSRQPASALPSRSSSGSRALEQPQPVLDLRDPQLELLELVARHEPELAKEPGEAGARPLAEPDASRCASGRRPPRRPSAPPRGPIPPRADSSSASVSARSAVSATAPTPASTSFSASSRELSALGHEAWPFAAAAGAPASPRPNRPAEAARRRATVRAVRRRPARPAPARASRRRSPRGRRAAGSAAPRRMAVLVAALLRLLAACGARTRARAPSRSSAAARR